MELSYILKCVVHSVQFTVHNLWFIVCSAQCTVYSAQLMVYSVHISADKTCNFPCTAKKNLVTFLKKRVILMRNIFATNTRKSYFLHEHHFTVCITQCTVDGLQCVLHSVQYKVHSLWFTVCSTQCTVYSAQSMVDSV